MNRVYMCIDLKSFYASVECVERSLDPLTTNLVVCDESRTEKTICLAVSPSLKSYNISGRARLFEVISRVNEINNIRKKKIKNKKFIKKSYDNNEVINNDMIELDFIRAVPRMNLYMKYSSKIYNIYLKYISEEDLFAYSIDEVFFDITNYLNYYKLTPSELATKILKDVYETTHITATCGIGTNLYLAKVAMDIVAKHSEPNENGVRIASLDEMSYRKLLWGHTPITDFWRVGNGYKNVNIRCTYEWLSETSKRYGKARFWLIDGGYEGSWYDTEVKYGNTSSGAVYRYGYNGNENGDIDEVYLYLYTNWSTADGANYDIFPFAGARVSVKLKYASRGYIKFGLVDDPNVRNLVILENNLK